MRVHRGTSTRMATQHHWHNLEANFSAPISDEVPGGAHVSFEIMPSYQGSYVLTRRPRGVAGHVLPERAANYPQGMLYFCYDLIRFGESTQQCIQRIVSSQIGVTVTRWRAAQFYSFVHPHNNNWALTPCFIAELSQLPEVGEAIAEVVQFTESSIPNDIAWWGVDDVRGLIAP